MKKKKILERLGNIEDKLDVLLAEGTIREVLEIQLGKAWQEKKELLDRLMSRDFETFKTYSAPEREEVVGEDLKPEEDADMAGEIFNVSETKV